MKKIAVVILNWNGERFLKDFLHLLVEYTPSWAEIVLADNASTDGSVAFIREYFPQIRIILNEKNYGFAQGYNIALQQIDTEYYCLLNSDIEVRKGWLEPIVDFLDKQTDVAVCQPKLLSFSDKTMFEYAGASGGFIDKYGYPFCRGRIFNSLEEDNGQYDDAIDIFWATGACMFVRASIYHELGGLDDDFFAHMEEIDFCWRVKNAGYRVMCCPDSVIYHVGGGTLPKKSSRKTFLNFRNNIILLYKNLPKRRVPWVFFIRFILDNIAAIRFLFDSGFEDFAAVYKAHFSFYASLRKNIRKRSWIKHKHVAHIYNRSIVFDYYLRKKHRFSDLKSSRFSK
ncbi:MAG: glycosyltransferase family 2 protein [Bacteroidales bacterium]|jgi:GT2 family glycosyltransferase|nr:glycosyltransferase family 2 protein [Bacteroidales bacterium]